MPKYISVAATIPGIADREIRNICAFMQMAQLIHQCLLLVSGGVTSKEVCLSCRQHLTQSGTESIQQRHCLDGANGSSKVPGTYLQGSHCHSQRMLPLG